MAEKRAWSGNSLEVRMKNQFRDAGSNPESALYRVYAWYFASQKPEGEAVPVLQAWSQPSAAARPCILTEA
jgi:hypothetical protein